MIQCLEWEPCGSFYQKHTVKPKENGDSIDHSGASGIIDMNLAADMTDPTIPPNPRKATLYRPSVTHVIAVSFHAQWKVSVTCLIVSLLEFIGCSVNLALSISNNIA